MIDAKEGRDVAIADVVGAYLLANMEDYVLLRLTGEPVETMRGIGEEYKQYMTVEKGKKLLYLRLKKALYGCMQSAILWYDTFNGCLEEIGFKLNRYNPRAANKTIDGNQYTICWYVDATKISHVDKHVVSKIISEIEGRFGKMVVTRGKSHNFVGMDVVFKDNGTDEILMKDYINECFEAYGEPVNRSASTPSKHDLFLSEGSIPLEEEKKEVFHHIVGKSSYVSKRARVDIELTVSYLCTRVSRSTEEDWKKLGRLLHYLHDTIDMPRIIGAGGAMDILHTYVDASYAIHEDMKGHTEGIMIMGLGIIQGKAIKQELNAKISTEVESIDASDYIPWTAWVKWL